jgi:glycerophosphoryl diester phosphodiesterase
MPVASSMAREIAAAIRFHVRPLLAFHIYIALLLIFFFTPAVAWLLALLVRMSGQSMVGNEDLIRFVLTPTGLFWLLVSGTLLAVLAFVQHAGMMLIASRNDVARYRNAPAALWGVTWRLPRLLRLAAIQVIAHLLVVAPFLAILTALFVNLLGQYDIYYVLNERPLAYWQFLGLAALVLTAMLLANGSLYLRWILALPYLLMEECGAREALQRSAALSRGHRVSMAGRVLGLAAFVVLTPILITAGLDGLGGLLLAAMPERYGLLIPVMAALVLLHVLLGIVIAFVAISANSLLILKLYHRRIGRRLAVPAETEPRRTGLFAWSLEALVVLLALGQLSWVAQKLDIQDEVAITAHRGSSVTAPENTLAAIEQAISDGADYVELDVRLTADGVAVLLHDRDLRRVAGVPRNIWEVNYETVRTLDVGKWFDPAFAGESIPTLEQAIEALRGRARLYLEIKPSPHSPDLTRRVVATLQQTGFTGETLLAALDPRILHEARRFDADLRTSLLIHTAIGRPETQPFDALALRDGLVTASVLDRVRRHGREVHVWTVNEPREMARFMDMGVDHIITDRPDVLAELIRERSKLSELERLLLRMRNWVW